MKNPAQQGRCGALTEQGYRATARVMRPTGSTQLYVKLSHLLARAAGIFGTAVTNSAGFFPRSIAAAYDCCKTLMADAQPCLLSQRSRLPRLPSGKGRVSRACRPGMDSPERLFSCAELAQVSVARTILMAAVTPHWLCRLSPWHHGPQYAPLLGVRQVNGSDRRETRRPLQCCRPSTGTSAGLQVQLRKLLGALRA